MAAVKRAKISDYRRSDAENAAGRGGAASVNNYNGNYIYTANHTG